MTFPNHDNHQPSIWTDERITLLRHYWCEQGLTASQCAALLGEGVTRNAVISKVHRMKFPKRATGTAGLTWKVGGLAEPRKPQPQRSAEDSAFRAKRRQRPKLEISVPRPTPPPEFEVDLEALKTPAWAPLEGTTPIPLLSLNDHTCKWAVLPDNPTALFCGCQTAASSPYCPTHKQRARGTGTIGEREAVKISKKLRLVGV